MRGRIHVSEYFCKILTFLCYDNITGLIVYYDAICSNLLIFSEIVQETVIESPATVLEI